MRQRGVTLLELMVTLAVLGVICGIVELALPQRVPRQPSRGHLGAAALRNAIGAGASVTVTDTAGRLPRAITAFPDGRLYADSERSNAAQ